MRLLPTLVMLVLSTMSAKAADWVNVADPPKDKIVWAADTKLKVEIPKCFFDPEVTFADHGGPFAALNVNFGQDVFRVFVDLQKGTVIGKTEGNITGVTPFALSRSGKRFAAALNANRVAIIEPTTGKVLREIELSGKPESMQFASDTRLAIIKSDGVEIYDTDTGKSILKRNLKGSHLFTGRSVTSPGGKYLFARDDTRISVFDIESDKLVTELPTLKMEDALISLDCIAVSPDGMKLAIFVEAHRDNKLRIHDLTTGKVIFEGPLAPAADFFYSPKLTWAADSSSLFFGGRSIIDIENGKEIFVLPANHPSQRIAITNRTVVVLDGERSNRFLTSVGVSAEQIQTAKAAVKTGGVAADALLPPLAKFDLSTAKVVVVPLVAGEYSAKPDPAPATIVPDRPIPVDFSTREFRSMRISAGPKPTALFDLSIDYGIEASKPGKIRQVDLNTGRTTRSLTLPVGLQVSGLAPDGSAFTAWHRGIMTRTDIFPIKEPPIGLRPFGNEANDEAKKVVMSEFISPTQLLTVSAMGKMILWSVPKMTPIYVSEVIGLTGVALSPGGKYLGGVQNGIVRLFDTQTGTVVGDLKPSFVPQNGNYAKCVVFRADGQELLYSFLHPTKGVMLVRWDLKTGNLVVEHALPSAVVAQLNIHYLGNNYVMVNNNWIYDFKHSAYVWRFQNFRSQHASNKPDDRVWYVTDTGLANAVLIATKFPDEATIQRIDEIVEGPGALIKVGTKVAMKYKITGSMAAEYKPMITSNLRKIWTANELVAATEENADLTVGMIIGERDTGKQLPFNRGYGFGFGQGTENIKVQELTASSQVFVGKEKIWESATGKYLSAAEHMHISLPNGETDVSRHLDKLMWQNAITWAENSALPRFLAKTADGVKALPESSILGSNGLEISPKK